MKPLSGAPILVADDDPDIRDILNDTLNSLGFRVSTAANGQECLDRLEREGSELLLLDIEMPNKTGLEVLKEIRQRAIDVTVIMITANILSVVVKFVRSYQILSSYMNRGKHEYDVKYIQALD